MMSSELEEAINRSDKAYIAIPNEDGGSVIVSPTGDDTFEAYPLWPPDNPEIAWGVPSLEGEYRVGQSIVADCWELPASPENDWLVTNIAQKLVTELGKVPQSLGFVLLSEWVRQFIAGEIEARDLAQRGVALFLSFALSNLREGTKTMINIVLLDDPPADPKLN